MAVAFGKDVLIDEPKPWQIDEVSQQVVHKIKKGEKAKGDIDGAVLSKAAEEMIRAPAIYMTNRGTGLKTRTQELAESVPIPDVLPKLAPRVQTFAFRYATEVRRHKDWAQIFHVTIHCIRWWLLKPEVMQYILMIRRERVHLMAERVNSLEMKAYEKLNEFLSLPINDDNAEAIRKAIQDVLALRKMSNEPNSISESQLPAIMIQNNLSNRLDMAPARTVNGETKILSLKAQLSELEMIESHLKED